MADVVRTLGYFSAFLLMLPNTISPVLLFSALPRAVLNVTVAPVHPANVSVTALTGVPPNVRQHIS